MRRHLLLTLPLLLGTWTAMAWAAPEGAQKAPSEVKEVFARLDQAINEHNLAAVMATYAPDDKTVLLGSGDGERWLGKEEIQGAYMEFFKFFDPGTQETRCTWTMEDVKGDLAWIASMCWITDFLKNQKREYGMNVTAILERLDGRWYFRAVHFSSSSGEEEGPNEENEP